MEKMQGNAPDGDSKTVKKYIELDPRRHNEADLGVKESFTLSNTTVS